MNNIVKIIPLVAGVLMLAFGFAFGAFDSHAAPLSGGVLLLGLTQNFPSLADFRAYMVNKLGDVEVVRQSLYDSAVYPTAGIASLRFFQTPVGSGLSSSPGNAGNTKQVSDTNMQLAGQLPAPQGFWVQSIEVDFQPGSSAAANTFALQIPSAFLAAPVATTQAGENDVNALYTGGALVFTVGQKAYLQEAPLLRFPPKARFELDAGVGSTSATVGGTAKAKLKSGGRPYIIDPGISLMTSQNFDATLSWPVAVATPSTFNARVMVKIDGWLFRAVQ